MTNTRSQLLACVLCLSGVAAAEGVWTLPPEKAELFKNSYVSEGGSLGTSSLEGRAELIDYVTANWRDLLQHIPDIPVYKNNHVLATMVIGNAAENLPPEEYLQFLDQFITLYSKGGVAEDALKLQILGRSRKRGFIAVNAKDPTVRTLLRRVYDLAAPEDDSLRQLVTQEMNGEGADSYELWSETSVPETLPGIRLPKPFESILGNKQREPKETGNAKGSDNPTISEDQGSRENKADAFGKSVRKGLALALAALVISILASVKRKRGLVR